MSWQTYVDDHLMCEIEGNHLSSAAISGSIRLDDRSSLTFVFKPQEITAIMNDFSEPGSLAPTGLYLGGTKYMVIQGEAAVIRGKKALSSIIPMQMMTAFGGGLLHSLAINPDGG
ncbi:hypothetical protein RJ639_024338 [Escallonia herrerae]|uniref:Profilin n=1 Tax=Escallonia herrerae TaxID=1293975 RepID=A0AA88V019_9ASTE|nr:hypothetical protein RJ639_024338 [Escallonia herrerae]